MSVQPKSSVVIDFDFKPKNSPLKEMPPVKMRLEHGLEHAAPTLEDIEKKLTRAEEKRKLRMSVRMGTDEKINMAKERKTAKAKEEIEKISKSIHFKLESAESRHTQAIESRIQKAKKTAEKRGRVMQTRHQLVEEKETQLTKVLEKVSQGHQKYEEKRQQTVQKAKDHSEKVS